MISGKEMLQVFNKEQVQSQKRVKFS